MSSNVLQGPLLKFLCRLLHLTSDPSLYAHRTVSPSGCTCMFQYMFVYVRYERWNISSCVHATFYATMYVSLSSHCRKWFILHQHSCPTYSHYLKHMNDDASADTILFAQIKMADGSNKWQVKCSKDCCCCSRLKIQDKFWCISR